MLPSMSENRNSEELGCTRSEGLYRKASEPVLRTHLLSSGGYRWEIFPLGEVAQVVGYSHSGLR